VSPTKGTPVRPLRLDAELWDRFGAMATLDRSTVLREHTRCYVRQPGAKMPRRPDQDFVAD